MPSPKATTLVRPKPLSPKALKLRSYSVEEVLRRKLENATSMRLLLEFKKKRDEKAALEDFEKFEDATAQIVELLEYDDPIEEFEEFIEFLISKLNENVRDRLRKDDRVLRAALKLNETVPHAIVLVKHKINSECSPSPFVIGVEMGSRDFCLFLLNQFSADLLDEVGERRLSVLGVAILHGHLHLVNDFSNLLTSPSMHNCFPFGCIHFAITNAPTDVAAEITNMLAERGLGINDLYTSMDMTMVQFALVNRFYHLATVISNHPNYTMKSHVCSTMEMDDAAFFTEYLADPQALYEKYKEVYRRTLFDH
jgi:hypothetical protein